MRFDKSILHLPWYKLYLSYLQRATTKKVVAQGRHLKIMQLMGRGRKCIMHHKFSHIRVLVLREVDLMIKVYMARTPLGKKREATLGAGGL